MFSAIERATPSDIRQFQNQRLRDTMVYLDHFSPFYKRLFNEHHIDPYRITDLKDIESVPVTTKDDLQRYNKDFHCIPPEKIIDYLTTSGTLGDPVTYIMSEMDLQRLAYNEALSFSCAGGSSASKYQLMTTLDRRFMAGLAYFLGIRMLGAGIVRVGNGIPELQWDTIHRIKPDTIVAVPSFILKVIEYAESNNIDYCNSSIKNAICIGEPLRNQDFTFNTLAKRISDKWPLKLFSTYASTEMATSFTECSEGKGGHHHPELIIVEFLDDHDSPVRDGEPGEVTITTLGVEGMPLLRFKTGDVCHHYSEPCPCGRNTIRLGPVIGRKNQMIKFKGTSIYPPILYDILDNLEYISNYIVEVSMNSIGTDEVKIHICGKNLGIEKEKEIKDHFRAKLRVAPEISFMTSEALNKLQNPAISRKPVKFIDNRV